MNSKLVNVTLKNGRQIITDAKRIDTKVFLVEDKSVLDLLNFCGQNDIPPNDTWFDVSVSGTVQLVHNIYESDDVIIKRHEEKLEAEYKEYLRLKEKFKDNPL